MRARGFGTVELTVLVLTLGFLWGFGWWAYSEGKAAKQAEWDRVTLSQMKAAQERDAKVGASLLLAEQRAEKAEAVAKIQYQNVKELQREAKRNGKPLGECVAEGRTAGTVRPDITVASGEAQGSGLRAPASAPGVASAGGACRVHWRFVGLHDAAFTGLDGKPLFAATERYAFDPARADAASPYGLEDVLEVSGENAMKFSECRRSVAIIRAKIEAAEAAWAAAR